MKLRTFLILLLVFFLLALLLGRVSIGRTWPQKVDISYAVTLTLSSAGGFLAIISVFKLLQRALSGQSHEQNAPLIVALLGGILLYQGNWGVALALGMVATGWLVATIFHGPKGPLP